ncbi:MAG TPA: hypothetical protein PKZ43_10205 [Bacteroidales bacterium]|jgi:hypothetical protein|nr:hypothetical protein [Bacteroidales bacterium]
MKNLETFFETSNFDSKNITNKGTQVIPQTALDKIEREGATLEFLQELKAPVFKYRTQITIHGIFAELKNNYLGGYKSIFQNKNLSIGVKWNAVDYSKKKVIYETIKRYCKNWTISKNSNEYFIYKTSKTFYNKEEYKTLLESTKADLQHIDNKLFFGNCGVYLSKHLYGGYFLVTYVNIGGILQDNVNKCIENICQADMETINLKFAQEDKERAEREAQRKLEYNREVEERKAKQAPIMDAAREILREAGYTLKEKTAINTESIFIKISTDVDTGRFSFTAYKYFKEPRQKKFRYLKATSSDLNFQFEDNGYNRQETVQTETTAWIMPIETKSVPEKAIKEKAQVQVQVQVNGNIETVVYSDKAIAIFGDTKPIKEKLKSIGARFNPFLMHNGNKQAGWILPVSKQTLLTSII